MHTEILYISFCLWNVFLNCVLAINSYIILQLSEFHPCVNMMTSVVRGLKL